MSDATASLVWFDPGVTTGICVLTVRAGWLEGKGLSDWAAMHRYVRSSWHSQIGRHAREWNTKTERAIAPAINECSVEWVRPHKGKENNPEFPGSLHDILACEGKFGGGDLTTLQVGEVRQVIECQKLLDAWPEAAWGYEDFVPRQLNQSREFLVPIHLFKMLTFSELTRGQRGRIPFTQSASTAKNTATDTRLSRAGLYREGMPHATDAARHCATFLRRARDDKELRAHAWPHLFS